MQSVVCSSCRYILRRNVRRLLQDSSAPRRYSDSTIGPSNSAAYRQLFSSPSGGSTATPDAPTTSAPPVPEPAPPAAIGGPPVHRSDPTVKPPLGPDADLPTVDFLRRVLEEEAHDTPHHAAAPNSNLTYPHEPPESGRVNSIMPAFLSYLFDAVCREADPKEILPVFRRAVYRHLSKEGGLERLHVGLRNLFKHNRELFLTYLYLEEKGATTTGTMRMIKEHFGLCRIPGENWEERMFERIPATLGTRLRQRAAAARRLAEELSETAMFRGSVFRLRLSELIMNNNLPALEEMYRSARERKVLNEETYAQFVGAFLDIHRARELGLQVWDDMIADGIVPSRKTWNYLLKYGRGAPPEVLLAIWDRMLEAKITPDKYSWNARIHIQIQNNHCAQGMESIELMIKSGIVPDASILNAALVGLVGHDRMDLADSLLKMGESLNIGPDVTTYNILLGKIMERNGSPKTALTVLEEMERRGIRYDVYTFTIILDGLFRSETRPEQSLITDALKILKFMEARAIPGNIVTYTAIITGLLKMQNHAAVKSIRDIMDQWCVELNAEAYTVLLKDAFRRGDITEAKKLYDEIRSRKNMRTDFVLWAELAYGFAHTGCMRELRSVMGRMMAREKSRRVILPWGMGVRILRALMAKHELLACREFVEFMATLHGGGSRNPEGKEAEFWELAGSAGGKGWRDRVKDPVRRWGRPPEEIPTRTTGLV